MGRHERVWHPGVDDERSGQQVRLGFERIVCGTRDGTEQVGHEPAELVVDCNVDAGVGGPDADTDAAIERGWTVREAFAPPRPGRW